MENAVFTRIAHCYRDSTAVVIGAGGIGGAIIQLLAGNAAQIVVADRDEALLEKLVAAGGPGLQVDSGTNAVPRSAQTRQAVATYRTTAAQRNMP